MDAVTVCVAHTLTTMLTCVVTARTANYTPDAYCIATDEELGELRQWALSRRAVQDRHSTPSAAA
eukprot:15275148-Alexandrium_andersonii.AAC.1